VTIAQLGEVASIVRGISFPKDDKRGEALPGHVSCLRTTNVQRSVEWGDLWFVPEVHVKREEQFVRTGDILISTANSYELVGKVAPVLAMPHKSTLGAFISLIRPNGLVDPKFLYHQLAWGKTQGRIRDTASTTTNISNVSTKKLLTLDLYVPELDEQRRIVAEIEKQFSRLDEAVANLQRVKANLKRYKAAVLKAAVEGRLVETEASLAHREGRGYETAAELIGKTPTPPRPNRFNSRTGDVTYGHGALAVGIPAVLVPEGWQWVNLVEIAKMESGHTPSRNHPEWWDGDVPWIGIADARDHHEQVILRTLQNTNVDGLANSAARLLPAGTVCVSRTASVGYVVVMGNPMSTSQDFVNWVPTSAVTSDWLRIVFSADREALRRFGKGSVHKTIYFPEWLSASIALPPLAEQQRIAAEVDRRISVLRSVESEVEANLRRSEALRQATLEKTFSAGVKNA
jgi:type I restriction enzyme S subunit